MISEDEKTNNSQAIAKLFTYLGGALILFGLTYLISINWFVLAKASRIFVSLGMAIGLLWMGARLTRNGKSPSTATVLFIIGAVLLPMGISVTLSGLSLGLSPSAINIIKYLGTFGVFLGLRLTYPRDVLMFLSILFGSLGFFALSNYVNQVYPQYSITALGDYQFMVIGLAFIGVAYRLRSADDNDMAGLLYLIGGFLLLMTSFDLAGLLYDSHCNSFWQVAAPTLVISCLIGSVPLRSKALLYLGMLFFLIYLVRMTAQYAYFFGNLGWPVILIASGIMLMILGYIIFCVQKYFPDKNHVY